MSSIINEFRLTGRMGGAVEVAVLPNSNRVGRVSLAVDASYRDRDSGELIVRTDWHDLTFFSQKQIERLERFAGRGHEIHVLGRIGKDVWDSKTRMQQDGVTPAKDSRVTLIVHSFRLGLPPSQNNAPPQGQGQGGQGHGQGYADDFYDDDVPC